MVKSFILIIGLYFASVVFGTEPAMAGQCADGTVSVSCNTPTAVQKGTEVPIWKVAYCVIGPSGGSYTKIDCWDSRAVHTAPTGNQAVCFVGTDGKVHWDFQKEVIVGRPFINHLIDGRWQPDWQTPPSY